MILKNISETTIEQMQGGLFYALKPGETIQVDIHAAQLWLTNHGPKLEKLEDTDTTPVVVEEQKITNFPPVETFKKRGRPRKS